MMLAFDQFGSSTGGEYLTLFHRYITRGIEALYARLTPDLQELSAETREQAWHLLDYGLKVAQSWEVVRKLLLAIAPGMEQAGFRHEWLPYLERGVAASRLAGDVKSEAQLSFYAGRICRLRGELGEAHRWFEASAALCKQIDDARGRALALNQLGYLARLQSHYQEAQAYVDEALSLLNGDDSERGTSLWVLGTMAQDQMKWSEAEHFHREALKIWEAAGEQQRAAWSLQNLGDSLRSAGRYPEAVAYIQESIVLLGLVHDPQNQAIARMNLGIFYLSQEDYEQAIALFALVEPVFRQMRDQLQLAKVYHNITMAERGLGHWAMAEQNCQRAISLWKALGEVKLLVNTLDELGLVYQGQERYAEAVTIFEEGLRLLSELPPDPFRDMLHDMLLPHLEEVRQQGSN